VRRPGDPDSSASDGGHAAERLREFLAKRLPPGAAAEELEAEIAKWKKENAERSDVSPSNPPDDID
jgi:hypothetical protein